MTDDDIECRLRKILRNQKRDFWKVAGTALLIILVFVAIVGIGFLLFLTGD